MAIWSQSQFLQSLGWAIINSFWQIALLWCFYLLVNQFASLNARKKYQLAVGLLFTSFAWFMVTFTMHFAAGHASSWALFEKAIDHNNQWFNSVLLAASVAYLGLLLFPAHRLLKNWKYIQFIKREGLHKADLGCRLFVHRISAQIGITKKVLVYVSDYVTSPLTVGYMKPVILLPLSALSHLTPQQVEAVLLHELSHIKRYDYIVNFILSIVHTLLYFNPFVKQFMKVIETERETCCDELVLQFGYDKIGYASALVTLEQHSSTTAELAIAATGKSAFFQRIETIVGVEKKKLFDRTRLAGVMAALICIIALNSVMIIREKKKASLAFDTTYIGNPFALSTGGEQDIPGFSGDVNRSNLALQENKKAHFNQEPVATITATTPILAQPDLPSTNPEDYQFVSSDDVENSLTVDQKTQVSSAVNTTKKVLKNLQWKEINEQIGDALNEQEKALAQVEFSKEIEKLNWQNVEQNMKAGYERMDWEKLNSQLKHAETVMKIDSLEHTYTQMMSALKAAEKELVQAKVSCSPIPDVSILELQRVRDDIKGKVEVLRALRANKKVVRL